MNRLWAHREPFSRGEKLLFAFLPLGITGFVLSALWLRRVEVAPQITFPAPVALPNPNGFDFYIAAARSIRAASPAVDPIDDRKPILNTNPQLAAQRYSLARRAAWLGSNAAGFALFKKGLQTPSRYSPLAGWGSLAKLRQLARSKAIEANTLILQKRWNAATQSSLDAIQMGYDVARGGPIMVRSMGSGMTAVGRDPLFTNSFVPEKLTAPQARAAARRLEAILATRPGWIEALKAGKWQSLIEFQSIVERSNWRSLANQGLTGTTWKERFSTQFLSTSEVAKRISDSFDQSAATMAKPYKALISPAPALDSISRTFAAVPDYRFSEGREIVPFSVLLLRLALRAYHLENGAYPTKLAQLAPGYLKRIPTDYFASGAPFGYRRRGDDYELWSVGPDRRDDGGVPMKNRNGSSGAGAQGRFPPINQDITGDYVARKNR